MYREVKKQYEWDNMKIEIEECIWKCKNCQVNKNSRHRQSPPPLGNHCNCKKLFEKCATDIVELTKITNKSNR
jgi:hypothetical protein